MPIMTLKRLHGRKNVEYLKKRGQRFQGKNMIFTYLYGLPPGEKEPGVYTGTSASLKLSKSAVQRNRMRRRCRESLRLGVKAHQNLPDCQLLLTPRSSSLHCAFQEIDADTESFLYFLYTHAPS